MKIPISKLQTLPLQRVSYIYRSLGLLTAVLCTCLLPLPVSAEEEISPLDIEFRRQAVRRLVFEREDAIPLSILKPAEVVARSTEFPDVVVTGEKTNYRLHDGLMTLSADKSSESALWVGGFNPFATYDIEFTESKGSSALAGVEFATPDNRNRFSILAELDEGRCLNVHIRMVVDGEEKEVKKVGVGQSLNGPFTFRVQVLGSGLNVFSEQNGVSTVLTTYDFSKHIDLRVKERIRTFEFRLLSMLDAGESVSLSQVGSYLTTGAGQADICAITYKDGSPILDQGRLWFTMSVRGRHLPHPLQGVFSLNPSVFDVRFEGIIVFDRGDGLLRNELASHIYYDRDEKEWRGLTTGFSAEGDPDRKVKKQLWAVSSKRDPRFGFSVMKAKAVSIPGGEEDPHMIYDADAKKWRLLLCQRRFRKLPAAMYESDSWDGPYKLIAGPANVDGTGCLIQKFGSTYYAIFGSKDRKFYVHSYPDLKPLGALNMFRPPWDEKSNTRCWPNVIPLPEGYPAPYIALSMDRANYPGLNGWTYGALYLYHGHHLEDGN